MIVWVRVLEKVGVVQRVFMIGMRKAKVLPVPDFDCAIML